MTFDQLVYSDFVSIRTFKIFTDSEFWQNSRSFADNIMSPAFEVSWGRKVKVRIDLLLAFLGAGHLQSMILTRFDLPLMSNIFVLVASDLNATWYLNEDDLIWDFRGHIDLN